MTDNHPRLALTRKLLDAYNTIVGDSGPEVDEVRSEIQKAYNDLLCIEDELHQLKQPSLENRLTLGGGGDKDYKPKMRSPQMR
jgi:hypothetical protein